MSNEAKSIVYGRFIDLIKKELTQALSELQLLEPILRDPDFKIGQPEDYTRHQAVFLMPYVAAFAEVMQERAKGEAE